MFEKYIELPFKYDTYYQDIYDADRYIVMQPIEHIKSKDLAKIIDILNGEDTEERFYTVRDIENKHILYSKGKPFLRIFMFSVICTFKEVEYNNELYNTILQEFTEYVLTRLK